MTFEEKIAAGIHDVNIKLDAFEAKAKAGRTEAPGRGEFTSATAPSG